MTTSILGKRPPEPLENSRPLKKQEFSLPDKILSYINLGYSCLESQSYERAKAHFIAAIEINPETCRAHFGLAKAFRGLGQYNESIDAITKAIEFGFDKHQCLYFRSLLYLVTNNEDKSIKDIEILCDDYLETKNQSQLILCLRAKACTYDFFCNFEKEKDAWNEILTYDSNNIEALERLVELTNPEMSF